jgi:dihydroorotate dehydrogenase
MGGLSGTPVKPLSLKTVSMFYKLTNGKVPIIGCGGISSAEDALEFAKAGASMVQLYTALGYQGPGLVVKIKSDLIEILKKENKSWTECIGLNHKQ